MNWARYALALATQKCSFCYGLGMKPGKGGETVCKCVLRRVFRCVLARYSSIQQSGAYMSRVKLERYGAGPRRTWGHRKQEFAADVIVTARRALSDDAQKWTIFDLHYSQGFDWKLCTRRLGITRGEFFHECYRIEAQLGRAWAEARPYALFPLDEYFCEVSHPHPSKALPISIERHMTPRQRALSAFTRIGLGDGLAVAA
jgi:hypothetical protein